MTGVLTEKIMARKRRRDDGLAAIRKMRSRMAADADYADRYLLAALLRLGENGAAGGWVLRKTVLTRSNVRGAAVLTAAAARLAGEGLVECRLLRRTYPPLPRGGGGTARPGTWYRLTAAGRDAARALPGTGRGST